MPRHLPPEEYQFKKGQSGNPGGRPKLSPELKAVRELSSDEIKKLFAKYSRMTKEELENLCNGQTVPIIEQIIAKGLLSAATHGDYRKLDYILDRTIGKITTANTDSEKEDLSFAFEMNYKK